MKYFIDTEFIESGPHYPIDLISIGIVAEDGRELYWISTEFDASRMNQWVSDNVIPYLGKGNVGPLADIAANVKRFIGADTPEFWGYYSDYDWVVFCQIFGAMIDLPDGWPMFCRDLKQLHVEMGSPQLPTQSSAEHNALNDARWNRDVLAFLKDSAA